MKTKLKFLAFGILLTATINGFGQTGSVVQFSSEYYGAFKNSGSAAVTVERIGDTNGTITVDYSTSPGTASTGSDYVERSGTLSFAPREALKTIAIPLLDDGLVGNDKTVNLTLGIPTGGALLGPQRTAVLRILDYQRPGSLDPSFNPGESLSDAPRALVVQADGKVWVSGQYGLPDSAFLLRVNPDGSLDSSFKPDSGLYGLGPLIGPQSIGRVIVSSSLGLKRIYQDGSIDTGYQETNFFSRLGSLVVQPDDKVIVSSANGSVISRVNAGGGVDDSFQQGQVDGYVARIALQPGGKILVGGSFSMIDGVSRQSIARLLPNGDLDEDFIPSLATDAYITSLVVQPDGKVIIGESFSTQSDLPRIVRLNADGSLDSSFVPPDVATNVVTNLALQTDGKLIVAGYLTFADGIGFRESFLSRLNTDGSRDKTFDLGTEPNGYIYTLALQADGKLLVGSNFIEINGVRRLNIARLNGDPPFKFGPLARPANGPLRLVLTGQPGKNYVLQASTNLMDWLSLSTNTPTGFNLQFDDTDAANFPRRFYRARQLAP